MSAGPPGVAPVAMAAGVIRSVGTPQAAVVAVGCIMLCETIGQRG